MSGTTAGLWLLVPEHLKLGTWDILKAFTGGGDFDLSPRIALQLVNESALCTNRVRKKNSLSHQGFQLANGMGRLVTDEQVHKLLDQFTMEDVEGALTHLALHRQQLGHYSGEAIAIDPHRINSTSKRNMPKKKKGSNASAQKMIQIFLSLCTNTGQPIMATMASTGQTTTNATKQLITSTGRVIKSDSLVLADKEHYTEEIISALHKHDHYDFLVPVLQSEKIKKLTSGLEYDRKWAGFATAETYYKLNKNNTPLRLIAQRTGERPQDYAYKAFVTSSGLSTDQLLTEEYDKRWSIEEFFKFEAGIGLNRALTHNLNIRYGKLAMSLIAQAVLYQLRQKLEQQYKIWNAMHLAREVLAWADGDISVKDNTIIVTFYGAQNHINKHDYIGLPNKLIAQNINPKIPWLYDYMLDFRFK